MSIISFIITNIKLNHKCQLILLRKLQGYSIQEFEYISGDFSMTNLVHNIINLLKFI